MKAGYYFVSGRYGQFLREVRFTNIFHAWAAMAYPSDAPRSVWLPQMRDDVAAAVASGKEIVLGLNMQVKADATDAAAKSVLQMMKPFWNKVISVELADEPGWSRTTTTNFARKVRGFISGMGLGKRPLYVVYTGAQILRGSAFTSPALDAVGIEAYIDYVAGEPAPRAQARMADHVERLLGRLPAGKPVVMVGMAYARNWPSDPDGWANPRTLIAIQEPYFRIARILDNSKRLISLNLFSYGRPSGTFERPALKLEHKRLMRGT